MSNGKPKVEIPAWQRTAQPTPAPVDDPVYSQPQQPEKESEMEADVKEDTVSSEEKDGGAEAAEGSVGTQKEDIARLQRVFGRDEFADFKQRQVEQMNTPPPQQQQQATHTAPPIITYPEFLVEAHKPSPLITPTRVLNTLYVAGGISTLLYAASKYIVTPMVDTLHESRHDFLSHSQSKVDELNSRLSKLVSKQPGGTIMPSDVDDDDSDLSDPTELYHRDMGTQTELPLEAKSTIRNVEEEKKKEHVEYAANGLKIIESHISEMADASDQAGEAHKDRREKMNELRHYLDQLLYGTAGGPLWTEDSIKNAYGTSSAMGGIGAMDSSNTNNNKKEDDAIEELKKEIRGVKGVLLSAKRFPPARRPPRPTTFGS